ncbi:hypothetical protein [Micromonospora sp. NPDC023956]|uniref:hypothetical protein n=1 Tax=Micromonospora sp. NPDC023956 TaxID=3155722 RepID=UPI0033DCDD7C
MNADPDVADDTDVDAGSDATRYLCVAAHTDDGFADRVLAEVLDDDLRAVAPSVGFDLDPVVRHCLAARRRRLRRDAALTVTGLAAVLLAPVWTLLAGVTMLVGTSLAPSRPTRNGPALPVLSMLAVGLTSVLLIVQLDMPASADGGLSLAGRPVPALLAGLAAYAVLAAHLLGTRRILVGRLRRERFHPERPVPGEADSWSAPRRRVIARAQHGNVTVYGGYAPFVGHGTPVAGWSFALPIRTADGAARPVAADGSTAGDVPFTVVELIDHVRQRLAALTADGDGTDRLAGLRLQDRVFVSGEALTGDSRFLPNRQDAPRQRMTGPEIHAVAAHPHGAARHYLCALVPSWGGEVVASTFLHFSTDGRLLYLECARAVLEPPRQGYHDVDRLTEWLPAGQLVQILATAAQRLLPTALGAPVRLLAAAVHRLRRDRRRARNRQAVREDLGHDYGAHTGVRELAAGATYHNYFQVLDAAKHLKVVERHVLAAILDLLDARGVDTTEFRSRQTTILNHGVVQTGGLSVVTNQAVGPGATAGQRVGTAAPAPRPGTP